MLDNLNNTQRVVLGVAVVVVFIGLGLLLVPYSYEYSYTPDANNPFGGAAVESVRQCGSVLARTSDNDVCKAALRSRQTLSVGVIALGAVGGIVGLLLTGGTARPSSLQPTARR